MPQMYIIQIIFINLKIIFFNKSWKILPTDFLDQLCLHPLKHGVEVRDLWFLKERNKNSKELILREENGSNNDHLKNPNGFMNLLKDVNERQTELKLSSISRGGLEIRRVGRLEIRRVIEGEIGQYGES